LRSERDHIHDEIRGVITLQYRFGDIRGLNMSVEPDAMGERYCSLFFSEVIENKRRLGAGGPP
jgi:hypothetical protein